MRERSRMSNFSRVDFSWADKIAFSGHPMPKKKKNVNAVALGRLGGLKGGKARASKLTPEQRSESARKASRARWERERQKKTPP